MDSIFSSFKDEWFGGRIDFDHEFGYQCVDLVRQWFYEKFGIGNAAGGVPNAISYWTNTPQALDSWKVASDAPQVGDVVVLNGLSGNSDGHIGIATGGLNDNQYEMLEQNGSTGGGSGEGGDAIRTRWIDRSRIAGLLRPPIASPAPAPVALPYTIEAITPKQVKLNKDTHLWNLTYDNFTAINANPVADAISGTILTARAILHHNIGYNYYLSDPNTAYGYNVLDCDDYTPPPAAPPAGPMPIPNSDTYEVIKEIPGFITSNQAINHEGTNVVVPAGTYFVFNKRSDPTDASKFVAINVTKTNGMAGAWINVNDNVETPPEPEQPPPPAVEAASTILDQPAFAGTYKLLAEPEIYVAMRDVPVIDLDGTKTVTMPHYSVTKISGTFVVNGIEYARPLSAANKNMWYGIALIDPTTGLANIELESDVFNSKTTVAERQATHTLSTIDKLALVTSHLRNGYLSFMAFLGRMKPESKNKK